MMRCRIADFLVLIAAASQTVSGQSRGAVQQYRREFPKDTIITIMNKTKDCQNIAEFHLPMRKGFVPKSVLNRIHGNLDRYLTDNPFYFDGITVKCRSHLIDQHIYNLTLRFEQGGLVWKEFLNIEVEDNGSNSQHVPIDSQWNKTPVRFVNQTKSETVLSDETSKSPPIQLDETSKSPPIQIEKTSKLPTVKFDETTNSRPIQIVETSKSPAIKLDETPNSPPEFSVRPFSFVVARDFYETGDANSFAVLRDIKFDVIDKDPGDAERLVVYTAPFPQDTEVPFTVVRYNGSYSLNLTGSLRGKTTLYYFSLMATDHRQGSPSRINVRAILLERPQFLPPLMAGGVHTMEINEDTPGMTSLLTIGFHDNDTAASDLTLRITDVSPRIVDEVRLFTLKDNTLYTAPDVGRNFDVDNIETWPLRFIVQLSVDDGELNSTTTVKIDIMDVNDNAPTFKDAERSKHVLDTTPTGTSIFHFRAWDADRTSPNNKLTYSMKGKGSSDFHLDPSTGEIRVSASTGLNYGRQSLYKLIITAKDDGVPMPRSNSIAVNITVDTAPKFIEPPHPKTVRWLDETLITKVELYRFNADDLDGLDKGTSIRYSIDGIDPQSARELFVISRNLLILAPHVSPDTFDVDNNATASLYRLNISVTDGTYTTKSTLRLKILDANDNAPVFTKPAYSATILDTFKAGDEIVRVSASDKDKTHPNNAIEYSLEGPGSRHFTINANNGSIFLISPLRLDTGSVVVHNLNVTATDKGKPRNPVTVPLTITINARSVSNTPTNGAGSVPPTTASGRGVDGKNATITDAVSDSPSKDVREEFTVMVVLTPVITVLVLLVAIGAVALIWYYKIRMKNSARKSERTWCSTMPMEMRRPVAFDVLSNTLHGSPFYGIPNFESPLYNSPPLYGSLWPNMPLPHGAYFSWIQNAYGHQHPPWYYKDRFFLKSTSFWDSFSSSEDDSLKNPH